MRIREALRQAQPLISFEFFPPKNETGSQELFETIETLRVFGPSYVSVTYGAGGSSRERTIDLCKRIKHEIGLEVMAHVTCVLNSRDDLRRTFRELQAAGIENIMALRGDPPKGQDAFTTAADGFSHACDLIELLAKEFNFCVGAAAYPEVHPEALDAQSDLEAALAKQRAGAEFLVTQLFFDNNAYFSFVDRARAAGITIPIVPGIMPITNYASIARMTAMCGADIPARLRAELTARADEPEAVAGLGTAFTTLQCANLIARGAPGIHLYTLNKSPATRAIVSALHAAGVLGARDTFAVN